jgi:cytoskeletal protein CcmA (bactofilin family)
MFERGRKDGSDERAFSSQQDSPSTDVERQTSTTTGARDAAVIGRSIHINGDLHGEEDLRIEGDVNGTIQIKSNSLTIGKEGKIRADVYAKSIIVDGLVEGDLYGAERVAIRKNAQVRGNITAPRVSLEEGARFKGSIEMDPEAIEAALGKNRSGAKGTDSQPKPMAAAANTSGSTTGNSTGNKPGGTNVPGGTSPKRESVG